MKNILVRTQKFIQRQTKQTLHANRYYNWYVFSRKLSHKWEEEMAMHYSNKTTRKKTEKTVVFLCNGFVENGGWADRLKGILSTYLVCKEEGLPFKLLFTSPFCLTDYLLPNTYEWRIAPKDVIYEQPYADIVALEIGAESDYQAKKQQQWLQARIAHSQSSQIHVCTNAHFCYYADFGALFLELFRPSTRLQQAIDQQKEILGSQYISVSARFINSLGDFTDTMQGEPLPPPLKEQLLNRCMEQIEALHQQHPEQHILINSDSVTFLNKVQQLEYTYVIPGPVFHLDTAPQTTNYRLYEKVFLDFFMIANASAIYRLETKWMHKSGYPLSAAMIYNRPFHSIKF